MGMLVFLVGPVRELQVLVILESISCQDGVPLQFCCSDAAQNEGVASLASIREAIRQCIALSQPLHRQLS